MAADMYNSMLANEAAARLSTHQRIAAANSKSSLPDPHPESRALQRGTTLLDTESPGTPSQPMELGWASMDEQSVLAYLRAVGDELPVYRESGLAPPLFAVAVTLGQILQQCGLPAGAIHSLQEYDLLRPLSLGSKLKTVAWLDRQRERGGLRFLTYRASATDRKDQEVLAVSTTLLVPGPQVEPQESRRAAPARMASRESTAGPHGELLSVSREITQERLIQYSAVSGDHNPLHLDPEFAAGTQFGGIIAHGMLTLAFVSEMLVSSLGEPWLTTGSLRARFKGAAYLGDRVETWGRTGKKEGESLSLAVGLANAETGEELITGTAMVRK